jgi:hypothetical protein
MSRRWHNVLTGLLATVACLLVVATLLASWTYATVLNTDRFVGTISVVTANPAVITSASNKLAAQVVEGFQIQSRLEALLPDRLDPLAAKFTEAVQERVAAAAERGLSNERFQQFWVSALRTMHTRLLALLRGDAPNADLSSGVLTIDLLGAISEVLAELQQNGVIDQSVQLPQWSGEDSKQITIDILNRQLSLTLPPDFGEVQVTNVAWLEQASAVVKAADVGVLVLALLSVVALVAAVWLADRRKRAVLLMTSFILVLLAIVWLIAGYVGGPLAADIAERQNLALILAMAAELAGSLMGWLGAAAVLVAVIGLVAAYFVRNKAVTPAASPTASS